MKAFYALQTPEGRFWDGATPYLAQPNMDRIRRWKPRFSASPTQWAREATALRKLHAYQSLQVVLPELPEMVIGKFEPVAPQLTTTIARELTPVEKVAAMIMFTYGRPMVEDFNAVVKEITPQLRYAMSVRPMKKSLLSSGGLRTLLRRHVPEAHIGQSYVFGSDEDLVMIKMLGVLRKYHDITSFLDLAWVQHDNGFV